MTNRKVPRFFNRIILGNYKAVVILVLDNLVSYLIDVNPREASVSINLLSRNDHDVQEVYLSTFL